MFENFTYHFNLTLLVDICLLCNWWLLSPFSLLLLIPSVLIHSSDTWRPIGLYVYAFGFVLSNELLTALYHNNQYVGYIFLKQVPNDAVFYYLFDKNVLFSFRYVTYCITAVAYAWTFGRSSYRPVANVGEAPPFAYPLKITYPIVITSSLVIGYMMTLIMTYSKYCDMFNGSGKYINYFLIIIICLQPVIFAINIVAVGRNYKSINLAIANKEDISSILTEPCHPPSYIHLDYYTDISTIIFAGSFILIIYLNVLAIIAAFPIIFDWSRGIYLIAISGYIGAMLAIYLINYLLASMHCLCQNYPVLVRLANYYVLVSCFTFPIRLQQSLNRCLLLLLKVPIVNLDLTLQPNLHYKKLILAIRKEVPEDAAPAVNF